MKKFILIFAFVLVSAGLASAQQRAYNKGGTTAPVSKKEVAAIAAPKKGEAAKTATSTRANTGVSFAANSGKPASGGANSVDSSSGGGTSGGSGGGGDSTATSAPALRKSEAEWKANCTDTAEAKLNNASTANFNAWTYKDLYNANSPSSSRKTCSSSPGENGFKAYSADIVKVTLGQLAVGRAAVTQADYYVIRCCPNKGCGSGYKYNESTKLCAKEGSTTTTPSSSGGGGGGGGGGSYQDTDYSNGSVRDRNIDQQTLQYY